MFSKTAKSSASPSARGESLGAPSIIGSDVRITGDLKTPGEVQFEGTLEGDLQCGALTVGQQAALNGAIVADAVVVRGAIIGSIRARAVRLDKTAKVIGDIWHEDITIESGAFIEGHCVHVDNPLEDVDAQGKPAPAEKPVPTEKAKKPAVR